MPRLHSKPFIDESGNIVIPQVTFGPPRKQYVVLVNSGTKTLRLTVENGAVVKIEHSEPPADEMADLLAAAGTSLDFWDNPIDDEVWNRA